MGRLVESYKTASATARATFGRAMTDHRALSPDMKLQRSVFAEGTIVTVNFGSVPLLLPEGGWIDGMSARWTKEGGDR